MNLQTHYLGLTIAHPFMVGASPLADHLDTVRRLEDGGSSAIVLRSLFEEQTSMAQSGRIHQMDPFDRQFADALAGFPLPDRYPLGPDEYLEHIALVKQAVHVPVIASLNGMTAESWVQFAKNIEQAGADGLELNPANQISIDHACRSARTGMPPRNVSSTLEKSCARSHNRSRWRLRSSSAKSE